MKRINCPAVTTHRRSLTSSPRFFSSELSSFHNSSHFSTLSFVSADRPIDLRKSSAEQMESGEFRIRWSRASQRTLFGGRRAWACGHLRRGAGTERAAAAAVCRHLVRDGTRVVNLVTDESMISGEKFAAKSGFDFSSHPVNSCQLHPSRRLKVNHTRHAHTPLSTRGILRRRR